MPGTVPGCASEESKQTPQVLRGTQGRPPAPGLQTGPGLRKIVSCLCIRTPNMVENQKKKEINHSEFPWPSLKKTFWWIFPQDSFQTSQNSKSLIHIYLYRWPLEASYRWVFDSLNLLFNRVLLMFNNPPNNHRVKRIHFYLVNVSRTFKRLPWTGRGRGLVSFKYGRQEREKEK